MIRPVHVLVSGWYGAGNVGDELLLTCIHRWVKEKGARLTALSINPAYTRSTHGIDAVDMYDGAAMVDAMRQADLFMLGGGGLFQTYQPFTVSGLYQERTNDISVYARPLFLARQMGVRTLLLGQGVGPLDTQDSKDIVAEVFGYAEAASVRDHGSLSLLRGAGVTRDLIVAPDMAWSLPMQSDKVPFGPAGSRIGIVVRPWHFQPEWKNRLIAALRANLTDPSTTLVWIPFQQLQVPARSSSDIPQTQELVDLLDELCKHEITPVNVLQDAVDALASCHGVICMRLHAQVIAHKLGCPVFSVEYDEKMSATSSLIGMSGQDRVAIGDEQHIWNERMERWLVNLQSNEKQQQAVAEGLKLSEEAIAHRDLLHKVIDKAAKDETNHWKDAGFDWIGLWRERRLIERLQGADARLEHVDSKLEAVEEKLISILEIQINTMQDQNGRKEMLERMEQQLGRIETQLHKQQIMLAEQEGMMATQNERVSALAEVHAKATLDAVQARDARDAQIAELNRQLRDRAVMMEVILSSNSWRLTRPLRFARRFFGDPPGGAMALVKYLSRRNKNAGKQPSSETAQLAQHDDLTWEQFQQRVLSQRDTFRGIFIQEPVIDWDVPLYQRPQHMACAFARLGYLSIYKTNGVPGFREIFPNLWLTNCEEVDQISYAVRSVYSTSSVHMPESLSKRPRNGVLVYEYIDHIDPQISGDPENIRKLVRLKNWAFEDGSDYIVVSARQLQEEVRAEAKGARAVFVPNGVDTNHYRDIRHTHTLLPRMYTEFRQKYKTIVGYFGAIAPWLWYDEIKKLVEKRTDVGFVFIGPDYYGGVERLVKADNVLYLGTIDYKVLPAYARLFDICFIPFEPGEIAKSTSPLKLFEYFALEKPVIVTSDMRECTVYQEVLQGNSAEAFSVAIDKAKGFGADENFRGRLRKLADDNDWDHRAISMEQVFEKFMRA